MEPRFRTRPLRDRRLQALALALWLLAAQAGAAGKLSPEQREQVLASGRVSRAVVEGLDREASVRVIVVFGGLATRMSAPACASGAISVGAVWDASLGSQTNFGCTDDPTAADLMTCWSNRNDRTDLFAPGAPTTSTGLGGGTSTYRGTSQAAPLVAACVALLLEMDPSLSVNQLEDALEGSPTLIDDPLTALSYPRLDCADASALAGSQSVPLPLLAVALLGLILLGTPLLRRG